MISIDLFVHFDKKKIKIFAKKKHHKKWCFWNVLSILDK